jgi:serine/threonine-protein kinase
MVSPEGSTPIRIDRYELYDVIASGGMATVHLGRLVGPAGFGRTVAIKRLHPHLAKEPEFVAMLTDEARVTSRIGHPNIVPTLDVVASRGELFLVMEYVPGLTLAELMKNVVRDGERIPVPIACAILAGVLRGLDAAHEARDESARSLEVVHRDVSPQNILVGADGVARLLDFGIAKAVGRLHTTRDGELKGKVAYMAPEQLGARLVDRRTDIYAASVVLWEALTGERLFGGDDAATVFGNVMQKKVPAPSTKVSMPILVRNGASVPNETAPASNPVSSAAARTIEAWALVS